LEGHRSEGLRRDYPIPSPCNHKELDTTCFPATQSHRITEWSGLEGTSVGHLPPAEAGSPRAVKELQLIIFESSTR